MPRVDCQNRNEPAKGSTLKRPNGLVARTVSVAVVAASNAVAESHVDAVAVGGPGTVNASVHALVNRPTVPAMTNNSLRPVNVGNAPVHADKTVKLYSARRLGNRTTHR